MKAPPEPLQISSVEIFSRSTSVRKRVNEDGWLFIEFPQFPGTVSFAVIDGAGVRKPLHEIGEEIRKGYPNLTPAAFASHILRMSLEEQLRVEPGCSLRTALIHANDLLRNEITRTLGTFEPEKIVQRLGLLFADDPRNVRLVLPTCVVTLARIDLVRSRLEFAHLGDTGLFEILQSGDVVRHTRDQMRLFDVQALESVRALQQRRQLEHFEEAVASPEGREFIIQSGTRLNYVDQVGKTDPQQGCGAVNGLPEMEDYLDTGFVDIDIEKTLGFFILSDGLELLSPLDENAIQQFQRYQKTAQLVRQSGLRGLYTELTQMVVSDVHLDAYPRTKLQDDATGIYLELGRLKD